MDDYSLYIVLTRTNTTISKLIGILKKEEYTHASISLDKELNNMYSFARRDTYNPFVGRFKKENINKGIYKLSDNLPGTIIKVKASKQQYESAKKIIEHFKVSGEYYKYNYIGIYHNYFNIPICSENRFLCSEFVYYVLNECGIADLKVSRNLVRPQHLLDIEGQLIYKGNLKKMIKPEKDMYTPKFLVFNKNSSSRRGLL